MKVIESDKVTPLFRLLLMNNPYADAIIRDVQELVELQAVDPIRAAGGCRCGECKKYMTSECLLCSFDADGSCTGGPNNDFFCGNSELIGGEDDG